MRGEGYFSSRVSGLPSKGVGYLNVHFEPGRDKSANTPAIKGPKRRMEQMQVIKSFLEEFPDVFWFFGGDQNRAERGRPTTHEARITA